ncbi:MAG: FHA domain-containing protein [Clostridiales bacterium]|jgi:hypothetical protein|nr:FHA domain-containing protein [Clostridiales bacterium]
MYKISHFEKDIGGNKHFIICQDEMIEYYEQVALVSKSDIINRMHLMDFKQKIEDDSVMYYYTVGDRMSLRSIAEEKGIGKSCFINVVTTIAESLSLASKYGLLEECFIIDKDYIFNGEIDTLLTYVPAEVSADVKAEFRRLMDFISDKLVDAKEEYNKISKIIKNDFTFEKIFECAGGFAVNETPEEERVQEKSEAEVQRLNKLTPSMDGFNWGSEKESKNPDTGGDTPGLTDTLQEKKEPPKKGLFDIFTKKDSGKNTKKPAKQAADNKPEIHNNLETVLEEDFTVLERKKTVYLICNNPSDDFERKKVLIQSYPFTITRKFPADITPSNLSIAKKSISKHHATINFDGENCYIMDIGTEGKGSTGGTFVNNKKIEVPIKDKVSLKNGDILKFYKSEYTFYEEYEN